MRYRTKSKAHIRSSSLALLLALTSVATSMVVVACGPEFTDCRSRRRCPVEETSGGMGGGGAGGAGESGSGGAVAEHAGAGGAPDPGAVGGEGGFGGVGEAGAGGAGMESPGNEGGAGAAGAAGAAGGPGVDLCEPTAKATRLIAPLSTALVTSRRPTVEFELGDDCGPAILELCADRACSEVIASVSIESDALSARPESDLPPGVVFWRVRSGTRLSAVWQFTVGQGTPVDTWWGTIPDFNGDGKVDVAVGTTSGTVYVYYGSEDGLDADAPTILEAPDAAGLMFGAGLASAGDVNGDGFADLVVGAPTEPEGGAGSKLYVFLGGEGGLGETPFADLDFDDYRMIAGIDTVVRGGADINGDGYSDFVATSPISTTGSYRVVFGQSSALLVSQALYLAAFPSQLGRSMALCDLNADRRTDLILGAPDPGSELELLAQVFVLRGTGSSVQLEREISLAPGFGETVACGDLQASGYPHLLVANSGDSTRGYLDGDVLRFANASGVIASTGVSLAGQAIGSYRFSGAFLAVVGDMNRDGIFDLAVGQDGFWDTMRVMFNATGTSEDDAVELTASGVSSRFGTSFTGGDVNGDGLADLMVSTPDFEDVGRITVYYGSRTARILSPSQTHIDAPPGVTGFGEWVSAGL